jgi:prepilin-type N-terminal cleavage/methylation domain-containing protein
MRLAPQDGYTVIELLVSMVILAGVLGSVSVLFVQASTAEVDLQNRFQAQQTARLALDKLRRETHCASDASVSSSTSVTLTLASYCPTGTGSITWCTVGSASRFGLYRKVGASCDATGVKWADYLTTGSVFAYTPQSSTSLAKLHVDFPVNVKPEKSVVAYELVDDIALRNSTRS